MLCQKLVSCGKCPISNPSQQPLAYFFYHAILIEKSGGEGRCSFPGLRVLCQLLHHFKCRAYAIKVFACAGIAEYRDTLSCLGNRGDRGFNYVKLGEDNRLRAVWVGIELAKGPMALSRFSRSSMSGR